MTKKLFLKFSMLLFVLAVSINAAWAVHWPESQGGYDADQAKTSGFWAKLTAKPATTTNGSGKVFVVADYNKTADPEDGDYAVQKSDEDWSDIYLASSLINADVEFKTFARADNGSYFTGWSFTDGYTDKGTDQSDFLVKVTPSSIAGKANAREYVIYAAFEPIKLVSTVVSGSQVTANDGSGNWKCTQTVTFRAETPGFYALRSMDDIRHFKLPTITKKTGTTGTWSVGVNNVSDWSSYASFADDNVELTVPVTFTAPNGNPGEYGAYLTLETYAGVKMTVYLSARTQGGDYEAIRYNKNKVQQETGDLTSLIANAATGDIIKLNTDYSDAVSINKSITFDLNGYTLGNSLTISGGDVTLAYSSFGGIVTNNIDITAGKLTINGGRIDGTVTVSAGAELVQNGATLLGDLVNHGTTTTLDGRYRSAVISNGTLLVNGGSFYNMQDIESPAITISGGTATIKRGVIGSDNSDQEYGGEGYYGVKTTGGATTIEKNATFSAQVYALWNDGATLTVNGGKFDKPEILAEGDITFHSGYFKNKDDDSQTSVRGKQIWRNTAGPEAREGYPFFAGDQAAAQAANVSVCRIGHVAYTSLEDALAYANNSGKDVIIIMENDYTLPAGYYTLPSNATLVVPMSNDQETANPIVPRSSEAIPTPVCFRKLTFASGVNMEVAGTLEVTCTQYGKDETMGVPGGNYGHLIMKPGSHMTINNGGYLRAWGFVTGDGTKDGDGNYLSGEIDARRGGTVHEMFQMGDWKGGDISFTIAMEVPGKTNWRDMAHLFPVYMYFIQNVEAPVKYHPGASLVCATSVNVAGDINAYANDIKVVGKEGEPAMFLMNEMADAENTWVRKYYDAKKDQQVYEVNSGAKLGSMVIDLGEVPGSFFGASGTLNLVLDSRKFVLPLTSNFKIHLLSGYMEFTQSTSCLPGMEVEVDKEAEVAITKNSDASIVSGALYLYDADQWSFQNAQNKGYVGNYGKFGAKVLYSATWDLGSNGATKQPTVRNITSPATIGDAILNVHGTFRMGANCAVYTTWSKNMETYQIDESGTGGASIISSNEDAGTFIFDATVPEFDGLHFAGETVTGFGPNVIVNYDHNDYGMGTAYPIQIQTVLNNTYRVFGFELSTSAKLKNGDGSFATTEGTVAGKSYCYMNDRWTLMDVATENDCFMKDNYGTFYAKPAEYVAVNATYDGVNVIGNADHTFSDKAGTGRLFILMQDDCQWWEVENIRNLYHCKHPQNDTYYYWDEDDEKWKEQRFTITWKNWDGKKIKSYTYDPNTGDPEEVEYSVTYGTMAEFLGSNPTREPSIDYTYDFTGWQPALGPVTSDITYTATFNEKPRKYTVIFTNEGGTEIERHFLLHNQMPACENVPTKTGFTLEWEPAIAAVTGDATYRATWREEPPTEYAVTFFDYDGTTKLKPTGSDTYMVAVGAMPVSPVIVDDIPTGSAGRPANNEFTYVFDHWSPALETVSATSAKSYTAVYREVAKTYTISYFKEDGVTPNTTKPTESLSYGATPTPPTVSKENPQAGHTYTLVWKTLDGKNGIQTVMGNASYKPTYLDVVNRYTVTLKSNLPGACTLTGAGTYDYGTSVSISVTPAEGYEFVKWQETESTSANLGSQTITGNITLTAVLQVASLPNEVVTGSISYTEDKDVNNFIITSDGSTSGEVTDGWDYLHISGNADFVLQQSIEPVRWYCIGVPWRVDVEGGIFIGESSTPAVLGSDFEICYYDGAVRAAQGKVHECWVYMKDLTSDKVLEPGRAYMIAFYRATATQIVFRKKAGEALLTTSTGVEQHTSAESTDAGWNAISNPALFHAFVNAGSTDDKAQRYNSADDSYSWFDLDEQKLVVGEAIYVQAPADKSIVVSSGGSYSPVHRGQAKEEKVAFDVNITPIDATEYTDHISVQLNADKAEDGYIIGQDLVKMGVSSKVAQMWVNRYDAKLCINAVAPQSDETDFPLSIFAPTAGDYTIAIERERNTTGLSLYLTFNGRVISNLQNGAYTLTLQKGTDTRYGLRIYGKAPQISQGIDAAIIDAQGDIRKVLIDNQVFIIRGDNVYTVEGQMVK